MTQTSNVKAVLLSKEQVEKLRCLQEQERGKSALGVTPSIHAIARALMDKALQSACGEVVL